MKKLISILIALTMLLCCVPLSSSAAEPNYVRFDAQGWTGFSNIYCHISVVGGSSFFGWQAQAEKCEKSSGTVYQYNLSKLDSSDYIRGGLQEGVNYCVIFSAYGISKSYQTCEVTFGLDCKGDTLYLTGEKVENPLDANYSQYNAKWTNNSAKYGPHLALTSVGNIVGEYLCPYEDKCQVIGDWFCTYNLSPYINVVEVLANAYPLLGVSSVKDVEDLREYICSNSTDLTEAEVKAVLDKAFAEAYGIFELIDSSKSLYIGDTYQIKPTGDKNGGAYKYTSANSKIASVSKTGKVTAKKAGKTVIKVSRRGITQKLSLTVKKPYVKIKKSLKIPVPVKTKLKVTKAPSKGAVSFSSSNKKIASVSSKGVVKAKKKGTATITAKLKHKGKTYTCKCKVKVIKVTSLEELAELFYKE